MCNDKSGLISEEQRVDKGKEADKAGQADTPLLSETEMLREEEKFLWPGGKPSFLAGLALSGGGVRAATVALGVLQVLAARGLLARFHYLSTVSGGGYIGSSLSWFWCQKRVDAEKPESSTDCTGPVRFGADAADFPFQDPFEGAAGVQQRAIDNLKFLRNHGSYLTSGDGIGFAGLIVAVTRTVLLSLAVWLPLLVFLFGLLEILDYSLIGPKEYQACVSAGAATGDILRPFRCRPFFRIIVIAAGIFVLAFFAGVILFSFLGRRQLDSSLSSAAPRRPRYSRIALYVVGFATTLGLVVWTLAGLDSPQPLMGAELALLPLLSAACAMLATAEFFRPANRGYYLRRSFEKWSSIILPNVVAALFVSALPLIVSTLKPDANSSAALTALGPLGGLVSLLSGVATALYGYYLKAKSLLPGIAGQIFATIGSVVFLAGMLLFSFVLARQLFTFSGDGDLQNNLVIAALLSLVFVALATGIFGSINATGLHRFYRDRLMETFMPMAEAVRKGSAQESDVADNLSVVDVVRNANERGARPYHLVNTHAILVNDSNPKVALRGGDNFLISPAFVGSEATGWMRTRDYVQQHGALTLASAMAVSGAAANANAGYIGTGVTRDRFVSAVMSVLNIRLGLWVGNPKATVETASKMVLGPSIRDRRFLPRVRARVATYFRPVLTYGIFGFGYHRNATFLELSDGGHFENLGLYELVRRRLDVILVVDAEQDSNIRLSALVSSINRIKEDFGVSIGLLDANGPERLLGRDCDRYPSGVRIARSPFVVAEISYPARSRVAGEPDLPSKQGALIYIKATMVKGLEFSTEGYRAANPDFPHQSTVDQFFDPDQFEAYRDLGKKICTYMIGELDLARNFGSTASLLAKYGFPSMASAPVSRAETDHTP